MGGSGGERGYQLRGFGQAMACFEEGMEEIIEEEEEREHGLG